MFYTVYKITNLVNDKIYIGVHKTSNLDDGYMGSGKLVKRAIEKYGIENFKKEYIEVFDNAEDMFNMESQLVNEEFITRDDTYNLKEGGFGGWDHIPIDHFTRNKDHMKLMSDKGKDKRLERLKELRNDKTFMKQYAENMKKGQQNRYTLNGYDGTFKGKKHTEDTKKKIGETNSKNQSGKGNSQYGTMWIHSLTEKVSKKINKDEFSTWEQQGWLKGRKMKF